MSDDARGLAVPPYLQSSLAVAEGLPDLFPEAPPEAVEKLQVMVRKLIEVIANRDEQIRQLYGQMQQADMGLRVAAGITRKLTH